MKILNTLADETIEANEKLTALTALVAKVKTVYGNGDVEITAVKVPTADGYVSLSLLSNKEKVAVATGKLKEVIAMSTAIVENTEGSLFDKVFEGFVAVDPVLSNLAQESDSSY